MQIKLIIVFIPMEVSIKQYRIKSGWFIVYIKGSHVILNYFIFSLIIDFVHDEMPHYAAIHLGFHCLPNYPLRASV